jgi:WD40 repeat protein
MQLHTTFTTAAVTLLCALVLPAVWPQAKTEPRLTIEADTTESTNDPIPGARAGRLPLTDEQWRSRHLPLASPGVHARFSPDGKSVAVTTQDGRVDLWDVPSGTLRARSLFKMGRGTMLRFDDGGDWLALWDPEKDRVVLADGRTLQLTHQVALPKSRFPTDVKFIPESTRVAVKVVERRRVSRYLRLGQERGVLVWDRVARAAVTTLGGRAGLPPIHEVSFSRDGRQMVSWFAQDVWVWDVAESEAPRRVDLGNVIPVEVQFVEGGELFVMARDGRAFQWDLVASAIRREWWFAPARSVSLRWPVLAAGDGRRDVVIWDARAGARQGEPLTEHPDGVVAVVLSDDRRILFAGSSRSLVVWDLATRQALARCSVDGPSLPPEEWEPAINANGTAVAVTRHDRKMLMLWTKS